MAYKKQLLFIFCIFNRRHSKTLPKFFGSQFCEFRAGFSLKFDSSRDKPTIKKSLNWGDVCNSVSERAVDEYISIHQVIKNLTIPSHWVHVDTTTVGFWGK